MKAAEVNLFLTDLLVLRALGVGAFEPGIQLCRKFFNLTVPSGRDHPSANDRPSRTKREIFDFGGRADAPGSAGGCSGRWISSEVP